MRKIKFLLVAMAMTIATSASAQFVGTSSSSKGTALSSSGATLDPKARFTSEFRVGGLSSQGAFGFTFGGRKDLTSFENFVLAWDFVNVEWSAPFKSPSDLDLLSLKTGLRLFTPSFASDNARFYTNLSMGYTCVLADTLDGMDASHGFGLTFGVGLQLFKNVSIGYSLLYETAFKSKGHFATFNYVF